MVGFRDADIEAMNLTDVEKSGLQVFRNYTKAFDRKAAERFVEESNRTAFDTSGLDGILELLLAEDIRFLPVIACSFADEQLKEMYRREIPSDVPGGRSSLLSGFGGLSRLSQRLQVAYSFNWISSDVVIELDKLRKIRNDTSHSWDINSLKGKLDTLITDRMMKLEEHLGDGIRLPEGFWETLPTEAIFRVRLIWLLGRCFYESHLYPAAIKRRLDPVEALYGEVKSNLLVNIAAKCVDRTKQLILATQSDKSLNTAAGNAGVD
jgi:hypothetical protein